MTITTNSQNDRPSLSPEVIGEQDARQGMKTGHIRWVLAISVVLAIIALLAAWAWNWPRMSQTSATRPAAAATFNATGDAATH
jgi:hypothetical protein